MWCETCQKYINKAQHHAQKIPSTWSEAWRGIKPSDVRVVTYSRPMGEGSMQKEAGQTSVYVFSRPVRH